MDEVLAGFLNQTIQGDCLDLLPLIPSGSVDMVLCDLPYGLMKRDYKNNVSTCAWDVQLPLDQLWLEYNRVIRTDGAIVLTARQPFTTSLITSNTNGFKYCLVWNKVFAANFMKAKIMPLTTHEDVVVFSPSKKLPRYFPIKLDRETPIKLGGNKHTASSGFLLLSDTTNKLEFDKNKKVYKDKFPTSILTFNCRAKRGLHPTQKPVALFEYLIRTYTNKGDLVLDNCCGSGTTGVACQNTGRNFIQMELMEEYADIARGRLKSLELMCDEAGDEGEDDDDEREEEAGSITD